MEALVQEFWQLYFKVFDYVFIPFVVQTITCVIYFSIFLQEEEAGNPDIYEWITKACVYVTTVYFAYLEVLQIIDKGAHTYLSELTNYVDMLSAILNFVLIIEHDFFDWYDFEM